MPPHRLLSDMRAAGLLPHRGVYTAATALTSSSAVPPELGDVAYFSNGLYGKQCLAFWDGTDWRAIEGRDYGPDVVIKFTTYFFPDAASVIARPLWICNTGSTEGWDFPVGSIVYSSASTSGTLQIEKVDSGSAMGSGTNILAVARTTNGTANTIYSLAPAGANWNITSGQYLALKPAGDWTGIANLCMQLFFDKPSAGAPQNHAVVSSVARPILS